MLECFQSEIDHRKLEDVEEDRAAECVNDRLGVGDERARDQHPRYYTERDQKSVFEWYFHKWSKESFTQRRKERKDAKAGQILRSVRVFDPLCVFALFAPLP